MLSIQFLLDSDTIWSYVSCFGQKVFGWHFVHESYLFLSGIDN